jgi:outer membrane receptor protein involved in Fe transport
MRRLTLLLICLCSIVRSTNAQELALSAQAPRFLWAEAGRDRPVELDPASTAVFQRRVTLDLESGTIGQALAALGRQTGLRLVYSRDVVNLDAATRIKAEDITVAAALTEILFGAGVDVVLSRDNRVTLVPRKIAPAPAVGTVVGKVTDAKTRTALVGATVVVEGTRLSATTGNDGRYRITEVGAGTYTVRARYIGYAPATASVTVSADQETTADFTLEKSVQRLDEVVTTGSVTATEVKALPNPITVITADDIRRANATRIDELFRGNVPGAVTWDQGTADWVSQFASVRGSTSIDGSLGSVKTYVDGVEVSDETSATIDPASIERIELIRGPQASTLYGSGALNGVLQIFTKRGELHSKPRIDAMASGGAIQSRFRSGSAVYQDYSLGVSGGGQDFSYNLGGTYQHQGAWVPDYYSKDVSIFGSGRGQAGPVTLGFTAKYYTKEVPFARNPFLVPYFPPGTFDKPNFEVLQQEQQTYGITADYAATPRWQHHLLLGFDKTAQEYFSTAPRFVTPADSLYTQGAILNFIKGSVGYNTTLSVPLGRTVSTTTTLGFDHYRFKEDGFTAAQLRTNFGFIALSPGASGIRVPYSNTGYYGQVQVAVADQLFLTGGARAEDNANFGGDYGLSVSPRVGASYVRALGGGLTLKARASYGRAIRAPYPTERFPNATPFYTQLGNLNIGPEEQRGPDAGLELYVGNRASLEATWYHQRAVNLIEFTLLAAQTSSALPVYQFQNVAEVKNTGWEFQGHVDASAFTLQGTYSIAHSTFVSGGPAYTGSLQPGDWLYGVPRSTAGLTLSYHPSRLDASVGLLHVGEWQNYDYQTLYASGFAIFQTITYPGFTKYNLSTTYHFADLLSAFVKVDNLANSHAFESNNFAVTRGRVTVIGLRFTGP